MNGRRLVLVSGIFPPDIGGPATYVPHLARELRERGAHVSVVCLSDGSIREGSDPDEVRRVPRSLPLPVRFARTTATLFRAAAKAELVIAVGLHQEASLAAALAGSPLVAKVVGDPAWERARRLGWFEGSLDEYRRAPKDARLRLLDSWRTSGVRRARRIIVPSRYLRDVVAEWGVDPGRVIVIPNAPPPVGGPESPGGRDSTPCPRVLGVGRLVSWKGFDELMRAVAGLPGVTLTLAGDGPDRGRLEALAADLGAAGRIEFLGAVTPSEVRRLMRRSGVLALNSTYEGLPHAVLEAMAEGLPVVATAAGGTPELIEHERTGLLVRPGDTVGLRKALFRLLSSADLRRRLAEEARRRLAESFAWEPVMERTMGVIRGCLRVA